MDVIIKIEKEVSDEIFQFLLNESFKLFVEIYGIDSTNLITLKQLKNKLADEYRRDIRENKIYAAYVNNELVGVASIDSNNYFSDLFIKKEYQSKGIGSMLFNRVVEENKENGDITMNTNPKYLKFFKKHSCEVEEMSEKNIKMRKRL